MNAGSHGVAEIGAWTKVARFALLAGLVLPLQRALSETPAGDSIVLENIVPEGGLDKALDFSHLKNAPPVSLDQAPVGVYTGVERGRKSVFVYLNPKLTRVSAERTAVKKFAVRKRGLVRYEYDTVLPNVLNLRNLTPDDIEKIKRMPGVTRVEEDMYHYYVLNLDESTPLVRGLQSQITGAGLSADGTGVRVCIADTGIDTDHIMYASRIDSSAGWDFANNDSNPEDDNGHGSHVSGIAVGGTGVTVNLGCDGVEPFQGGAPNATLIGVKILNSFGGGADSDIIAGIDHCADQTASGGRADVINLSIGTGNFFGTCTHSWAVASNNAVANGVVVVAASGNENNSNSMGSPACGVNVIAVGATYKAAYPNCEDGTSNFNWGSCTDNSPALDQVVCFSNESDLLDVTAPGSVILSASNAAGGTSTTSKSGTSMASPLVAGLAALVLDADPSLTPAQVRQLLRDGATDMGPAGFDRAYGYGRVDFINTLQLITPCTGDPDCDDGLFCNGAETCNTGSCVAGSDPCPGQSCDEATNTCVAAPTVVYEWNMDTNPGWTGGGQWAWGTPTGGGGQYGGPDPTSGATGSNVFGYNLNGDYANNLPETNLTTAAIDCTNLISTSVRFQRWLGVEQPTYDRAYVRVSNDGNTWTTVWSNGAQVADTSWGQVEYDISAVADGQSTVFVRWTMGTTDSSWQFCGWNIDDVQIIATDLGGGATCSDGILNQGETRIDCGGPCAACACTSDAACDDGLFCNGTETCDAFGVCQGGSAVNCNDGVGCTTDSCNEGTNSCDNVANNAACDDGLFCNGTETCDAVNDCQAGTAVNCNDGVGCTDDSCNEGTNSCDNVVNNANCDNGLFCDGSETCDAVNDCQAGTAVNCNDGVGCTTDSCNEGTNSCDNTPNNAACDNGVFCDGAETCDAVNDCQAGTAVNCNDGVGCTADSCNEGTNSCDNVPNDASCDNGLFCDGVETCDAVNDCQAGTAVNCNDGVGCTDDTCNEATNSCDSVANDANCDNGLYCDGTETCDAVNDCQAGTAINCADGVACTDDTCNEGTNSCDNVANDANCDNGLFCDGAEICDAVLDCQAGTAVNCDDGVGCTSDSCNEVTNACDNTAVNAACDDGLFCTGAETCDALLDCQAGSDPCPGQTCDEGGNVCVDCTTDPDCDDGLFCNGAETCVAGACQSGTAVNCGDGVACTDDSCNEATNACDNVANDANCDNGLFCDGTETCDALFDCQAGTAVNCNDGVGCTDDSCNEVTNSCDNIANNANCDNGVFCDGAETCDALFDCQAGTAVNCNDGVGCTTDSCNNATSSCDNVASNAACDDGVFCNGAETCDAVNDCQLGSDPCPGQSCDEVSGTCVNCLGDPDCDDGLFCNGAETCVAGVCQAGTAVNCDDGVACTDDACNEGTGSCDNVANDANCDNGLFCDGAETCDAALDCLAGAAVNCDDGVACTTDSCNEGTASCDNTTNDAACDDGLFCNGAETCDAINDCQAGTAVNCNDGVGCTDDSCNEGTSSCDNVTNDANCDNGLFCDGAETCDAVNDCQAGADPCPAQGCDEVTNTCLTGPTAKMESGVVSIGANPVTVTLANTYVSPVVVCTPQYNNNTTPVVARVSNVTGTSFDVRLQNPSNGAVAVESVHCLIVEEGAWTIAGVNIEAQTYLSTVTDENNSWNGEQQTYLQGYTSPVVLGQVMSENDPEWSVFWCHNGNRKNAPNASSLWTGKNVAEDSLVPRADETVGFIVIETGHGTINGVEFEASLGGDSVRGIDNAPPYNYSFDVPFAFAPTVTIVNQAAMDGGNGGWAYVYGGTPATSTTLFLVIDEDQIKDSERRHTTEQVGYMVFDGALVYP